MNNERKILFNSVTATINIQPTNEMFLRIMTSSNLSKVVLNKLIVKNTEYIKSQVTCRYVINSIMLS